MHTADDEPLAMHVYPLDSLGEADDRFDPDALDPGIRAVVLAMRAAGLPTHDSGDGETEKECPATLPFPHVVAHCRPSERFGLAQRYEAWAVEHGASVGDVDVVHPPDHNGKPYAAFVFLDCSRVRV